MKQGLELQVYDGNKLLAQGRFDQAKIVVGRILSADFRVPDSRISRIHALIERQDDGSLRLTDLASSHGTTVNGEKIIERNVGPADQIQLAGLKLVLAYVQIAESETPSRPSAAPAAPAKRKPSTHRAPAVEAPPPRPEPQVAIHGGAAPAVSVSRDPTVIRSLKETARSRGVLDQSSGLNEELELTVYWQETVLDIEHCRSRNRSFFIGEAEGNDYIVPSQVLPPKFEFIKVQGSTAQLSLHPSMKGSARVQGQMQTLEQFQAKGQSQLTLSGQDIAKVQIGQVNFFVMFVGKPPAIPRDRIFDQGPVFWGLSIVLSLLALITMFAGSQIKTPIEGDVKEFPERFRKIIVEVYKKQAVKSIIGDKAQVGVSVKDAQAVGPVAKEAKGNEGEGAREAGREGKRGNKNARSETGTGGRVAPKTPPNITKKAPRANIGSPSESILSTLRASKLGKNVGVVGGGDGGAVDNAFADRGRDTSAGYGGVSGTGKGNGGSGLQGDGPGGGGTVVGAGGLGTKGFGAGSKGNGPGAVPGKGGEAQIATESLSVRVLGGLSREEIERVVNAHASEIQFCYSRELQRDPNLNGKVTIKWTIEGGGAVTTASVKGNSTGSASLAGCIRDNVKNWLFPSPPSGSKADVEWPWIFKPKGT